MNMMQAPLVSRLLVKGLTNTYPTQCHNQQEGHHAYPPEAFRDCGRK